MFCDSCSKLAVLYSNKTCASCKGPVYTNISIICETCSIAKHSCSACLKKVYKGYDNPLYNKFRGGCKGCGR